jgi:hypothetical protein
MRIPSAPVLSVLSENIHSWLSEGRRPPVTICAAGAVRSREEHFRRPARSARVLKGVARAVAVERQGCAVDSSASHAKSGTAHAGGRWTQAGEGVRRADARTKAQLCDAHRGREAVPNAHTHGCRSSDVHSAIALSLAHEFGTCATRDVSVSRHFLQTSRPSIECRAEPLKRKTVVGAKVVGAK